MSPDALFFWAMFLPVFVLVFCALAALWEGTPAGREMGDRLMDRFFGPRR